MLGADSSDRFCRDQRIGHADYGLFRNCYRPCNSMQERVCRGKYVYILRRPAVGYSGSDVATERISIRVSGGDCLEFPPIERALFARQARSTGTGDACPHRPPAVIMFEFSSCQRLFLASSSSGLVTHSAVFLIEVINCVVESSRTGCVPSTSTASWPAGLNPPISIWSSTSEIP